MNNILNIENITSLRNRLRAEGRKVVFTNGCFDILHAGHVDYIRKAKALGDILIVGINSDASIRRIKGEKRPIVEEADRAELVASLKAVDYVTVFDEDTPGNLISALVPDVLVKGADWSVENIVGRDVVEENGGRVETVKFVSTLSTSKIIETIIERYKE
jgi:D-beta-D-heptose 7-phosphate kinase/D-beta-D-heptose 1-phosphate adenosyltransferase